MTEIIGVSRPRVDAPEKVTGATRFAADGYVHGLLHARLVLATEAHARIRGIDGDDCAGRRRRRRRAHRGRPPDRDVAARTARRSRSRARRSSSPDSPSRSSSPRPRPPPRTAPSAVVVDYEPLAAVVDVEAAMKVGAALVAHGRGVGRRSGRPRVDSRRRRPWPGGRSAGGAVGQRPRPDHAGERGRRGRVGRERRRRRRDVPDAVGLPGVPRAAGVHRVARAVGHPRRLDEHPGHLRDPERDRADVRSPARARPGDRRAARRRLRRRSSRSSSRSRRQRRCALKRPVRLVAHPDARTSPRPTPRPRQVTHLEDRRTSGRHAHGHRRPPDRRSRLERRMGRRGNQLAARRGPLQLGGVRHPRLRRPDEPRDTSAPIARPGAPTAAFALESLLDELAARLDLDPIELRLRNAVVEGDVGISGNT